MGIGMRTGRSGVGIPPSGHGNQRQGTGAGGMGSGGTRSLRRKAGNGVGQRQDEGRRDVSHPDYWYGGLVGDGKPPTAGAASGSRA